MMKVEIIPNLDFRQKSVEGCGPLRVPRVEGIGIAKN